MNAAQCDVEFVGGGRCTKAAGHRTLVNQDPHTPPKTADEAMPSVGALPMPAGPAPLSGDVLADYAAMDFTDLMDPDAAAVVARMRDRMAGEIQRLQSELAEKAEPERLSFAERARRESDPGRRQAWRMLAQVEESERVFEALVAPDLLDIERGES